MAALPSRGCCDNRTKQSVSLTVDASRVRKLYDADSYREAPKFVAPGYIRNKEESATASYINNNPKNPQSQKAKNARRKRQQKRRQLNRRKKS